MRKLEDFSDTSPKAESFVAEELDRMFISTFQLAKKNNAFREQEPSTLFTSMFPRDDVFLFICGKLVPLSFCPIYEVVT